MPNTKDTSKKTPFWQKPLALLSSAINAFKTKCLYLKCSLLNKRRDYFQATFLHDVAKHGTPETARTLIKSGADVNAKNNIDNTPLHLAAVYNTPEMVKVLIEAGADLNIQNDFYEAEHTPLAWVLNDFKISKTFQTPEMLEKIHLLIKAGATFTIKDAKTMLARALYHHQWPTITHPGFSYLHPEQAQETAKPIIKIIQPVLGTSQETLTKHIQDFPEATELLQKAVYKNRKNQIRENKMQGAHLAQKLIDAQQSVINTPNQLDHFSKEIVMHIFEYVSPIKAHQNALVMGFQQRLAETDNNPTAPSDTSSDIPSTRPPTAPR